MGKAEHRKAMGMKSSRLPTINQSAQDQSKEMRTYSDEGIVTGLDSQDRSSDFEVVGVGNESCCAEVS